MLGPADQAVTQEIIITLQAGGVIIPARRFPYVEPVFLFPESKTESQLIMDYSKLTPYLPCLRFYLPSVFQLINFLVFEIMYLCKLVLKYAFFHINIHPDSQCVTAFRFNGQYFKFTCLSFGLSVSLFFRQMLTNCIDSHFRVLSHIDDFVIAHLDYVTLKQIMKQVLLELVQCGVIN